MSQPEKKKRIRRQRKVARNTERNIAKEEQTWGNNTFDRPKGGPRVSNTWSNPGSTFPNNRARRQRRKRNTKKEKAGGWNIAKNVSDVAGTLLGAAGATALKAFVGGGDYEVESNSMISSASPLENNNTELPIMKNGKFANRVRHREYVGDIVSSVDFVCAEYPINPGIPLSFPWLAPIANNYEQYVIKGMIYEFKSLSSDYTGSPALGYVVMATTYNSLSEKFGDKRVMENHEFANSCKPSVCMVHPIECERATVEELYVRAGPVATGDLRLYDLGKFSIATGGQTTPNLVLGELWCSYEIDFYQPRAASIAGKNTYVDHFNLLNITNSVPLNVASTLQAGSTLGGTIQAGAGGGYFWPPQISDGTFLTCLNITGTSAALTNPGTTLNNIAGVLLFHGFAGVASTGTGAAFLCIAAYDILRSNASLVYSTNGSFPTGTTGGDFFVVQLPTGILARQVENLTHLFSLLGPETRDLLLEFNETLRGKLTCPVLPSPVAFVERRKSLKCDESTSESEITIKLEQDGKLSFKR